MFSFKEKSKDLFGFLREHYLQIIVVLLLTFVLFEILLRVGYTFLPGVRSFLYSSRYDLNFSQINNLADLQKNVPCPLPFQTKINGLEINRKGFYTPEYQEEKGKDVYRVIFLGDSFLVGVVPYQQNFVSLLGEKLGKTKGRKVEVINLGLPCLGPQFEEKIFEIEGLKLKPDLVIWNFFIGNDFTDEQVEGEKLPLPNLLTKNIYVLRFVRNLQKTLSGLNISREVKTDLNEEKPTFTDEQFLRIQGEKMNLFSSQTFPSSSWKGIQETLLKFKKNCDENKIQCLVVIIPDENQINGDLWEKLVKERELKKEDLDQEYPQEQLEEFLKANQFSFLDPLFVFQKEGLSKKLYHPNDTHWNLEGNQLAAEEILKYLNQ